MIFFLYIEREIKSIFFHQTLKYHIELFLTILYIQGVVKFELQNQTGDLWQQQDEKLLLNIKLQTTFSRWKSQKHKPDLTP